MGSNPLGDRLLTVDEVARYLGYSIGTVYNKVAADEIPHIRLGRTLRFRLSDIDAWIEEQDAAGKARTSGEGDRDDHPDEPGGCLQGKAGAAEVGGRAAPLAIPA